MAEQLRHEQWKGRTGGQPWMQQALVGCFKVMNIRILYFMMMWALPFYMLCNHKEYLAMYRFFKVRFGHSRIKAFCNVCVNHYRFGQIILDRFAAYAGKTFLFDIEGKEVFDRLAGQPSGFIQLSSHVGNYEMAGYSFNSRKKRINAVVFDGETATVMQNRAMKFSENNMRMVPVCNDMSHVFVLNEALGNGEIVSLPGDRVFGSPRYVNCSFLGADARFPMGPFAMATQRGVPAIAVFVMKISTKRYKVYVRSLDGIESGSRKEKIEALAQAYADELEAIVRQYPTQWFNYYDFWSH